MLSLQTKTNLKGSTYVAELFITTPQCDLYVDLSKLRKEIQEYVDNLEGNGTIERTLHAYQTRRDEDILQRALYHVRYEHFGALKNAVYKMYEQ